MTASNLDLAFLNSTPGRKPEGLLTKHMILTCKLQVSFLDHRNTFDRRRLKQRFRPISDASPVSDTSSDLWTETVPINTKVRPFFVSVISLKNKQL